MKRRESKEANAISRDKSSKILKEIPDLTLDGIDFLVSDKRYETQHISGVAKSLFKKHGFNFENNFSVVVSVDQLKTYFLDQSKPAKVNHSPLYIIFRIYGAQWVTICVTQRKNGVVVLYKNPLGGDIPKEVLETILKCFGGATIQINRKKEQVNGNSCDILALRNMEIIMEHFLLDNDMLIAEFENIPFCSENELKSVKDEFKTDVGKDIVETCISLVKEIAKNSEFKKAVAKLVDSCVVCIDLLKDIEQYDKTLREEGEKQGESAENAITQMKEKLMNHPQIRLWSQLAESAVKDRTTSNRPIEAEMNPHALQKSEIEEKYPKELEKFTKVFKLLGVEKELNKERTEALRQVSEILGIDHKNITKVYHSLVRVEPFVESLSEKDSLEVVRPLGVIEIDRKSSALGSTQAMEDDPKEKLVEQILAELAFTQVKTEDTSELSVKEARVFYKEKYRGHQQVEELETQYRDVKKYYDQWKSVGIAEIQEWVRENKGQLNINLHDAMAVMNRANELVTGHRLRDTQILAVLDILGTVDGQGKLCQIETGEGKTVIVSLLAAFKVLQGKRVDMITSNEILAEEGVKDRKYFFGVLGISVDHNNPDESKKRGPRKCYTADVVYGSMEVISLTTSETRSKGLKREEKETLTL